VAVPLQDNEYSVGDASIARQLRGKQAVLSVGSVPRSYKRVEFRSWQ
jgi:hypothetical protein